MGKQRAKPGKPMLGDARPKGAGGRQVPIAFPGADEMPIYFVNAGTIQLGNLGEIIMTLGQASLPIVTAVDEAERERQFARIKQVNARVVARLAFTPESLRFIASAINTAIKEIGDAEEEGEEEEADADVSE